MPSMIPLPRQSCAGPKLSTIVWLALGTALHMTATAQTVGEVEFSRGAGFAQTATQTPRTLGKGLVLREGDRLTTADGAAAIIKLADGTRMTLRPNSEVVLQQYRFTESAPDNSMVMQLLRGGFRAITGLISKNSPNAASIRTSTATIGIRGTDFDARLCDQIKTVLAYFFARNAPAPISDIIAHNTAQRTRQQDLGKTIFTEKAAVRQNT